MTLIAAELKETSKHYDKKNINRTLAVHERIFYLTNDNEMLTVRTNIHVSHDDIKNIFVISVKKGNKLPAVIKVSIDEFLKEYHDYN